jgi:hypothetical protein
VPISFKIDKQGMYLEGADRVELVPGANRDYELTFRPKRTGKFRASLIFTSEKLGEFWYDMKMTSLDPMPIVCELMQAQVGWYANNPFDVHLAIVSASL